MLNKSQKQFAEAMYSALGTDVVSRNDINTFQKENGYKNQSWLKNDKYKIARGQYQLPIKGSVPVKTEVVEPEKIDVNDKIETKAAYIVSSLEGKVVPNRFAEFVPWGHFKDIKSILKSKSFYPIFITGLSGNGKTLNVTQAAAELNRELIRVNITIETDEDDLLGGYRLRDGDTVWQNGPVIEAMERGAVLLLDEIDLASNKIMCLQPILEGNGIYVKKINKFVAPKDGFTVVATANTKGQGSESGKFIGTNVLNEAFLERFPITVEQSYPTVKIENKILQNVLKTKDLVNKTAEEFTKNLVTWADVIRKTYYDGGIDEIVSTRRLVHIVEAYSIFKDKMKSIEMCTNRFDDDTKASFLDLYTKVDAGEDVTNYGQEEIEQESNDNEEEVDNQNF